MSTATQWKTPSEFLEMCCVHVADYFPHVLDRAGITVGEWLTAKEDELYALWESGVRPWNAVATFCISAATKPSARSQKTRSTLTRDQIFTAVYEELGVDEYDMIHDRQGKTFFEARVIAATVLNTESTLSFAGVCTILDKTKSTIRKYLHAHTQLYNLDQDYTDRYNRVSSYFQ